MFFFLGMGPVSFDLKVVLQRIGFFRAAVRIFPVSTPSFVENQLWK